MIFKDQSLAVSNTCAAADVGLIFPIARLIWLRSIAQYAMGSADPMCEQGGDADERRGRAEENPLEVPRRETNKNCLDQERAVAENAQRDALLPKGPIPPVGF